MSAPQPGLLQRLQQNGEQAAWGRLVDLCSPHLFLWACRAGLPGPDAANLVREVFAAVLRELPLFRPGATGGFRGWLRNLAHRQRRELLQARKVHAGGPPDPPAGAAPVPPSAEVLWEEEYLPHLLRAALEVMQADFPPLDEKALRALTVEGRPAAEVARELGVPLAALYVAEARALARLRQELDGLLD